MGGRKKPRPRYERAEEYPSHRFTPRDGRVIRWVWRMRFLTREQIQRLEYDPGEGATRYCRTRLRWLFDEGYLDRRPLSLGTGYGTNVPLYCLDEEGAGWVAVDQMMERSEVGWRPRDNEVKPYFMEHTLAVNDFWIDVVLATRESECELVRWIDERTLGSDEMKDYVEDPEGRGRVAIVPDGYFRIRLPDGQGACFALELDRSTVSGRRWREKVRAYVEYQQSGRYEKRYGTHSLRVLTVVEAARRPRDEAHEEKKIRRRVKKMKSWTEKAGGRKVFWFAAEPDIEPETLLEEPIWQVASEDGHQALLDEKGE